ncbi:MAG: hypothetical protein COB02_02295 [Candidatus Cloacimonadota bacterium]|nr:MAG: hypothetical protein COB02_02295 [Candidatus Cloacimonadota bacterium]
MNLKDYDSLLNSKKNDENSMPFSLGEIQKIDIKSLMNKSPKVRYQSIKEFLNGDYSDKITILRKLYKIETEFRLKSFIQSSLNDQQSI